MTSGAAVIAAYGLPTKLRSALGPLDDEQFSVLLADCETHRLLGLLARATREGAVELSEQQVSSLEERYRGWLTHALRVERLLIASTTALDRQGIPSRVLKGVALAHTAYDDPNERVFGDVDLLVPSEHFTQASRVLGDALGGERAQPELRSGFDDRYGKEIMLRVGGLELDLHRTFVEGAYGLTIRLDDLFAPPYRFPVGVWELEALPMPQRFLHACYAAALGDFPPRLISLRDLAQVAHREQPNLVDVLLMARAWQCEPVVARAVNLAWDSLELTREFPVVTWARRFAPTRRQRLLLDAHQGAARAFTRQAAAVLVLHGTSDRAAYLRSIMFPGREYLESRRLTMTGHVGRAWRRMLR